MRVDFVACKNGCGRPVAEGLARSGRAYDTCCKSCGMGRGEHDPTCKTAPVCPPAMAGQARINVQDAHDIDTAVDKVQMLVLRTYAAIRAQISDQIELFAESFFKLPMMRRLADDMQEIELDEDQKKTMRTLRLELEDERTRLETTVTSLE